MEHVAVTSTDGVAAAAAWTRDNDEVTTPAAAKTSPFESAAATLSREVRAVLAPATSSDVAEAQLRTRQLAGAHYENFSVVSLLLPRHLRQDFCNIYAFCRVADDLGDELDDPAVSMAMLSLLKRQTLACQSGRVESMLFAAVGETLRRHDIPVEPLLDLIDAFEQDQRVRRYETFADVVDYCRRSANPVGRLVLYMCGYRDEQRQKLSDATCTALQLANFWQDVRRDLLDRDRIYLPAEDMRHFGVTEDDLHAGIREGRGSEAYAKLIEFEVDRTARMFDQGDELLPLLDSRVRGQIALYGKGGRLVLDAIRVQGFDTLARRPALGKWQKGRLVLSALTARLLARRGHGSLVRREPA
jgi:squalene synthase HpnC